MNLEPESSCRSLGNRAPKETNNDGTSENFLNKQTNYNRFLHEFKFLTENYEINESAARVFKSLTLAIIETACLRILMVRLVLKKFTLAMNSVSMAK